jgi:hypothetical protein
MRYEPLAQYSPYSIQQTQVVVAVCKLKENPTYGADLAHWIITFGPVTQHIQVHQFYSKNNSGA